ncbi:hypothetical protein DESA109040_22805 [Deinococcus saxicola]
MGQRLHGAARQRQHRVDHGAHLIGSSLYHLQSALRLLWFPTVQGAAAHLDKALDVAHRGPQVMRGAVGEGFKFLVGRLEFAVAALQLVGALFQGLGLPSPLQRQAQAAPDGPEHRLFLGLPLGDIRAGDDEHGGGLTLPEVRDKGRRAIDPGARDNRLTGIPVVEEHWPPHLNRRVEAGGRRHARHQRGAQVGVRFVSQSGAPQLAAPLVVPHDPARHERLEQLPGPLGQPQWIGLRADGLGQVHERF